MRGWRAWGMWLVVAVAVGAVRPAGAQGFGGPKLSVNAGLSVERVRPGDSFEVGVVLPLPAELHVNAHVPSEDYLLPTELTLSGPKDLAVGPVVYPRAHERKFTFTEKPIRVYEGKVLFRVPAKLAPSAKAGQLVLQGTLSVQPCSGEACYAPTKLSFSVPVAVAAPGTPVHPANPELFAAGAVSAAGGVAPAARQDAAGYPSLTQFAPPAEFLRWLAGAAAGAATPAAGGRLAGLLRGGNWLLALPLIFLAGLALNLTPCVYPLIPITVSYFGGQASGSRRRTVTLAVLYVLGMVVTYSSLGALAAATGGLFGAQLQSPYVLAGFAAVMAALALSMFGVWEMRLPSGVTSKVSARAGYAGAVMMGLLVGLVAAPCVGPAVVALLQVVGQRGDPLVGFGVFFALAMGLGTPYLVLGSFSGLIRKLPRSGEWMDGVKHLFGVILLGMALHYLSPLLGAGARPAMSAYLLAAGVYLLAVDPAGRSARRFFAVKRALGAAAALAALWTVLPGSAATRGAGIPFQPYSEERLRQAQAEGRPVLIDFRADWCAACKELEEKTFRDPKVVDATRGMVALRKDLTRSDGAEEQRLRREYGIVGLPHVVFVAPPRPADGFGPATQSN